jgi:aromatic-L-amino-acid decarboxylase
MSQQPTDEIDLDPEDWDSLRLLGHRMVDDMFAHLESVRSRPVWQPMTDSAKREIRSAVPIAPMDAESVYEQFRSSISPFPTGNTHPRFWGWVMGTGTPVAMLADMLASGMNAHVAGYDQSASVVEHQVIEWLRELMGFPEGTSGVMTGGGTMANLIGLAVARQARAGFDVRSKGVRGGPAMAIYASTETHAWIEKAVELLGHGSEALRRIQVDREFRIDLRALRESIRRDREAGLQPIAIVGTAGTVNTGATDDLVGLRQIADQEGLWFHVDGAFGALAALAPHYRHLVEGMDQADSLAFDLHKWAYLPFEAGVVLVRDHAAHQAAFRVGPNYLATLSRGILSEPLSFAALGIDLSRGFRALKAWMSFKVQGFEAIGRVIEQNIEQATYLEGLFHATDASCEVLAPVAMNVVVFRYNPGQLSEPELDRLNEEILMQLQESGEAMPSSTRIDGHFAIRVAITNHRSRREDFEALVAAVTRRGRAFCAL